MSSNIQKLLWILVWQVWESNMDCHFKLGSLLDNTCPLHLITAPGVMSDQAVSLSTLFNSNGALSHVNVKVQVNFISSYHLKIKVKMCFKNTQQSSLYPHQSNL